MPPTKPVNAHRFGSKLGSRRRNEFPLDQAESQSNQGEKKRTKTRLKQTTRSALKVKFPNFHRVSLVTKDGQSPIKWISEPAANTTKSPVNEGKETENNSKSFFEANNKGADTVFALDEDVFFFSQRSNVQTTNEKEKAKLSVLRTISRMLEENQLIRQRLASLSQAS